jgi:hypothetical protein
MCPEDVTSTATTTSSSIKKFSDLFSKKSLTFAGTFAEAAGGLMKATTNSAGTLLYGYTYSSDGDNSDEEDYFHNDDVCANVITDKDIIYFDNLDSIEFDVDNVNSNSSVVEDEEEEDTEECEDINEDVVNNNVVLKEIENQNEKVKIITNINKDIDFGSVESENKNIENTDVISVFSVEASFTTKNEINESNVDL